MLLSLVGEAEGEVEPLTLAQAVEVLEDTGHRLRVNHPAVALPLSLP